MRKYKEAEKKKGFTAQMSEREKSKIDKKDIKKYYKPDLSLCKKVPILRDGAPKLARPIGYRYIKINTNE